MGPSDSLRSGGPRFLSPRVKQPVCEVDLSPPTSADVKTEWNGISILLCAFMDCTWKNLLYMDDGCAADDGDSMSLAGKKMNHA